MTFGYVFLNQGHRRALIKNCVKSSYFMKTGKKFNRLWLRVKTKNYEQFRLHYRL